MGTATEATIAEDSKANQAYEALRHRLIMLDITPGEAINEVALTTELGIGRTPVREALKRLENNRLIVSYPRRGTYAANVDITDLAMISEVRVILEPLAARKAAQHRGEPVGAQLRDAISELQKLHPKDDQRRLLEYDLVVHRLIYRATNNHHLAETLVQLDDLATRIWCLVQDRIPEISEHIHEHIELMQSILDGDEDRAATLAAEHVRHFEATVRAAL